MNPHEADTAQVHIPPQLSPAARAHFRAADRVACAHAAFLVAFGAWPNLHMRSFEAVTGKKRETWLVRAVGLLLVTTGSAIALARREGRLSSSTRLLAAGVSASLGGISLTYASRGRIRRIYYLDAALHAAFVAAWMSTLRFARARPRHEDDVRQR